MPVAVALQRDKDQGFWQKNQWDLQGVWEALKQRWLICRKPYRDRCGVAFYRRCCRCFRRLRRGHDLSLISDPDRVLPAVENA